jgi:hypothetical protein
MEINLFSLTYLIVRLAPFILVCYFTLGSVFNQDLKGIIYLIGLLIACFISTGLGNINIAGLGMNKDNVPQLCKLIELSNNGPISKIPLGMTVLSYTFFYLLYIISVNKLWNKNIPTFIIFPIFIILDAIWNFNNGCASILGLITSFIVGSIIGITWGAIIISSGISELQYFNGISNKETCNRPSKTLFRCKKAK